MHTDPIADLLTRIRNASTAHHEKCTAPHSKTKENILKVMKEKGFIKDFNSTNETSHNTLEIMLNEESKDITMNRVSTPGQRIYIKKNDIKTIKSGLGITIISTSKGIMSNLDAKKQNLGGEVICEIY